MPERAEDRATFAKVVSAARNLRSAAYRPDPSSTSPAAHDLADCLEVLETARPVERVIVCADLWTAIAADHLYGLSLILADGTTGFGMFPLLRSIVEHSTMTMWVLDARVSAPVRGARATACVLHSAERACAAMSHLHGRSSNPYQHARGRLRAIQKEAAAELQSMKEAGLSVEAEPVPRPTDVVRDYGKRSGTADLWEGIYDFLCSMATHPNLDALGLAKADAAGRSAGFAIGAELIQSYVAKVIRVYIDAIVHLGTYMEWPYAAPVEAFRQEFNAALTETSDGDAASA